ncbi:MAG TPA: class I SAM-dependent methyltransferase [Pseudomonadales bacterium]
MVQVEESARTWHHGLVARWWAEFNHGGEDVEFFRRAIERSGEPALDAGCGTGRLLLPFRRAGLDVDGSDAAPDMLAWCRKAAEEEGLSVALHLQAMHRLQLPRRYRTIIACGSFGLGGSREQDLEGLRRIRQHLEPGGHFVMDHHLPNLESPKSWGAWVEKPNLPRPWPERGQRRVASDGTALEMRVRQVAFDPLAQTTTLAIRISQFHGEKQVNVEEHAIDINLYFRKEIELMLAVAGFRNIRVEAFGEDRAPEPWVDERIIFSAVA